MPRARRSLRCRVAIVLWVVPSTFAVAAPPDASTPPPGHEMSTSTKALAAGARVLQSNAPLSGFDIHLDGFHAMKDAPHEQMEAHHYCRQVNEDFAQCVLFDGNTQTASLTGVEYIISASLFAKLPDDERGYWHPHNYEILSGQLVAPGIPDAAEHALMRRKIDSYGKTWHFWRTGMAAGRADALPLGDPMLAWSFNRDGEADAAMVEARDRREDMKTQDHRANRADLVPLAHPQAGVDLLKGAFGPSTKPMDGVVDSGERRQ
jgi:uncharacterized protein DUF1264